MPPTDDLAMLERAGAIAALGQRIVRGEITTREELARALVGLALDDAPVELLREYLTNEAAARDDLVADVAERAKAGPP